jgi:histidine kinase
MNRILNLGLKNKIFIFTSLTILWLSAFILVVLKLPSFLDFSSQLGVIVIIICLFVVMSYRVSWHITRPIVKVTKMADELARGILAIPLEVGTETRCWEIKDCNASECPAYDNLDRPCWYLDQTLCCGAGLSGYFPEKVQACSKCEVYRKHVGDEFTQLGHSLLNMMVRLKASEGDLKDSEKKYRTLFDTGPNPVFVLDRETLEILDVNPSAEKTYGYLKEELIGKPFHDLGPVDFVKGDFDSESDDPGKEHTFVQKVRHFKKGEIPFYVNAHSCPMLYGDREALKIVTTDITEVMEKDAQLIQASKMTSLGEMSAGIAHELNQPLNVIKVGNEFLRKMLDERKKIPEENLYQVVNEVRSQVDKAAGIINRLREFSRKADFNKEPVDINAPIRVVLGIVERQLKLQNIKVRLNLEENLPPIWAHKNRLEQVMFNLMTNACDAINQKINTPANSDNRFIEIHSYREGDQVAVTVSDTGIGIPDSAKDKVFEPFFTTKETGKGIGLGLSIVYGIVKDYNGHICVEGEEGEGAGFKVTFPIVQE